MSWSKKWLAIISLLAIVGVVVAACGATPEVVEVEKEVTVKETVMVEVEKEVTVKETVEVEKEVTVKETVVVETVATPTPAPEEEKDSEIVIAHPGPIYTMDAPVTWYGSTHWLTMLLYDCLIWRAPDLKGYVPMIAESWEAVEPDRWRFKIREGATFHNGEPITAETIRWNIDRVRSREDFMVSGQWGFVKDLEVVDDYTLDVITDGPRAYTEYEISFNGCELLPPGYIEEVGEEAFAQAPVGSGPYKLVEFVDGERYVFEAWDDYWGGKPAIDRVIYQVIPERASQVAALFSGQVDFIPSVPMSDRELIEAGEGIQLVVSPPAWAHQLELREETEHGAVGETYPDWTPTTESKLIRQAISHALDRTLLAEIQGAAVPTLAYLTSTWPEVPKEKYTGTEVADAWYDPELSKQLIKEAGYDPEGGNKPHLYFDAPDFDQGGEKEVAEAVQFMLEDVGFEVDLTIVDNATYREKIMRPGNNRDAYIVTTGKGPTILLTQYSCSWTGVNYICREELDALNEAIFTEVDTEKRMALWEDWWEIFLDESIDVTLYEINRFMGANEDLQMVPRADGWITPRDWVLSEE